MQIRKKLLPRRLVDYFCFLLIFIALPIIFLFELIIVLPQFHAPGGFWHTFTFCFASFLIFNLKGNMIACILVDTSANVLQLKPPANALQQGWHECMHCARLAPPRSWHCNVCGVCILKRDHHCLFMGCCIGHHNHRYFLMFLVYLLLGASYAFVYNTLYFFVLQAHIYAKPLMLLKLICPMLLLVNGTPLQNIHLGSMADNIYLTFYGLNIVALLYAIVLLCYLGRAWMRGSVCYEMEKKQLFYNQGLRQNLQQVLGKRMHVAWLSPLVLSELPNNGIDWPVAPNADKLSIKKNS